MTLVFRSYCPENIIMRSLVSCQLRFIFISTDALFCTIKIIYITYSWHIINKAFVITHWTKQTCMKIEVSVSRPQTIAYSVTRSARHPAVSGAIIQRYSKRVLWCSKRSCANFMMSFFCFKPCIAINVSQRLKSRKTYHYFQTIML